MIQAIKRLLSPKDRLIGEMLEKRPLPLGMSEFDVWSERIIQGAMIEADPDSQKFALADMILHLNATEDHKEDGYFIKVLRKIAANQIADAKRKEMHLKAKERHAAEQLSAAVSVPSQDGDVTPTKTGDVTNVLEKADV